MLFNVSFCYVIIFLTALTAQVILSADPLIPEVNTNVTLTCQVQVEELLCPSGTLSLQLPNGTVITTTISSPETEIIFELDPFLADDFGKYFCNVTVLSPQFPQVGFRAFQGLDLEGNA